MEISECATKFTVTYRDGTNFESGLNFGRQVMDDFLLVARSARKRFGQYYVKFPLLASDNMGDSFSYSLEKAKNLNRKVDTKTFAGRLQKCKKKKDYVAFPNLSRKSILVVPCPKKSVPAVAYRYVSDFMHLAPRAQVRKVWSAAGRLAKDLIGITEGIRLNTHGGGVAYLHIRLDGSLIDHEKCHH